MTYEEFEHSFTELVKTGIELQQNLTRQQKDELKQRADLSSTGATLFEKTIMWLTNAK